jgi:hypothetical protein
MAFDMEMRREIAESTANKIKRQVAYYIKALRGRHKRLIGGLAGLPITKELANADTIIHARLSDPRINDNYRTQLLILLKNRVEPFEDLYHDGLISTEDILYGKSRHTQHEVLDAGEALEDESEEDDTDDTSK